MMKWQAKPPQSHINATSKPPQGLLIANRLRLQSHPKATLKLPQSHPKATLKFEAVLWDQAMSKVCPGCPQQLSLRHRATQRRIISTE